MIGQRLPDGFECTKPELDALGFTTTPRGAYWRDSAGAWCVVTPNGRLGSIAKHTVEEHPDGTITVAPSILVYAIDGRTYSADERAGLVGDHGEEYVQSWERGRPAWHGYLEHGVWREC